MKFFRWYFVLPLLLALACTSAPPAGNPSADQLLLYEISGNGLQESSFIFGTLHFIPSDLFLVPEALSTRLKESDALVLEANIDIPLMDQIAIAQRTLLPSQHSLRDYLPPDKYEESIRYMIDSLGISEKKANRYMYMKPVYLLAPLLMEYYGSVESYEKEFIKMAKKEDKQLLFLEEISFQLDLLDSIPLEVQLEDFSVANFIKEYEEMLSVYLEQDLDKLEEFITSTEEYADYEELIMNVRNRRWVPELQQMMAEQSVFAAVGAGHLFGEKGVLNLLAEEGYEVRQVKL